MGFNFKSAICTSLEQSKKLLALGLKKETADMSIGHTGLLYPYLQSDEEDRNFIPAWSLHRLIKDLMPDTIAVENATCMGHRFFYLLTFMHDDVTYEVNSFVFKEFTEHDNYYDNIIDCIEWLIKEGYFNKEYLVC